MSSQLRFRRFALLALMVGITLLFVPQNAKSVDAAGLVIDHFLGTLTVTAQNGFTNPNSGTLADASAIEGVRDIFAQVTNAGATPLLAQSNVPLGQFSASWGSGDTGNVIVQWDGTAGYTVAPGSFSVPQNLTLTGNNGIGVVFTSNDNAIPMTIRLYGTASANCIQKKLFTPDNNLSTTDVPKIVFFPFSTFTTTCPGFGSGVSPTAVSAIELVLESGTTQNTDLTIEFVEAGSADFGDAPNTYFTNNLTMFGPVGVAGPAHYIPNLGGVRLGSIVDTETNGQPTGWASGDDQNPLGNPDDEDGVAPVNNSCTGGNNNWSPGQTCSLNVTVSGDTGCLFGWIDWDNGGDFDPLLERVIDNVSQAPGTVPYSIVIPSDAAPTSGIYMSRFRIVPQQGGSCVESFDPTDKTAGSGANITAVHAFNGEVEDHYLVNGVPTAVTINSLGAAVTKGNKVRVKWETGNELNVIGFNVWRKQGKAGWQQRNADLIQAQNPGGLAGASYKFVDTGAKAKGKYKLEAKMSDGTTSWSSIVKIRAK